MTNEWAAGAKLCVEQGFNRPATVFQIQENRENYSAFILFERAAAKSHWSSRPKQFFSSDGLPLALFRSQGKARSAANLRNAQALRERNLLNHFHDRSSLVDYLDGFGIPEFEIRVGQILGIRYRLEPDEGVDIWEVSDLPPMFPSTATDEQMTRIVALFKEPFFYVREVHFSDTPSLGDSP